MIKRFGTWLVARHLNAGLAALACVLLSLIGLPTSIIAGIIVAFVTLRVGPKAGLILLAWVALPAIALFIRGHASMFDLVWLRCFILWGLGTALYYTHSWNLVLCMLTLIGVIGVALIHALIPNVEHTWYALGTQMIQSVVGQEHMPPAQWDSVMHSFARFGSGIVLFCSITGLFLQLLCARYWQASIYNPGGSRQELMRMRIQRWISLILPICILLAVFTNLAYFTDVIPVILFPFVIVGFVCLHAFMMTAPKLGFLVPVAYIATFFVMYLILVWSALGFVDAWVDFPARLEALKRKT
jgi:hypothetical protein